MPSVLLLEDIKYVRKGQNVLLTVIREHVSAFRAASLETQDVFLSDVVEESFKDFN
jgi:hypothetical protein